MGKPKVTDIHLHEFNGSKELQIDWDNDRHHAVAIQPFGDNEAVATALECLIHLIMNDRLLLEKTDDIQDQTISTPAGVFRQV